MELYTTVHIQAINHARPGRRHDDVMKNASFENS